MGKSRGSLARCPAQPWRRYCCSTWCPYENARLKKGGRSGTRTAEDKTARAHLKAVEEVPGDLSTLDYRSHGPQGWTIETQGWILEAQGWSPPRCLDISQWVMDIPTRPRTSRSSPTACSVALWPSQATALILNYGYYYYY